ncbi:protease modulator HflC [Yunchengibacter salinarum]|uniref:protease modulator HflC n=1 Tax=Yunchengibacter salinarum TaxID=3133399 RepID=UPI0035B63DA5
MKIRSIVLIVLIALGAILASMSMFTVDERKQAIVVQFGEPKRTITEPGLHFKTPFVEQVILLDRRLLSLDVPPQEVIAEDQRRIVVDSFARFRIVDPLKTYQAARTEAKAASLLENIMFSNVRQVLADETMLTIVSGQRAALMERIGKLTNEKAETLGLEVADVRLIRVDLPKANSEAVFSRMRAEREQEAALERAEGQREASRIRANADRRRSEILAKADKESEQIRGRAEAVAAGTFAKVHEKDPEFFKFYRTLQAYRASMSADDTTLVLSPDSEFFRLFMGETDK